jgi:hypothetical protein
MVVVLSVPIVPDLTVYSVSSICAHTAWGVVYACASVLPIATVASQWHLQSGKPMTAIVSLSNRGLSVFSLCFELILAMEMANQQDGEVDVEEMVRLLAPWTGPAQASSKYSMPPGHRRLMQGGGKCSALLSLLFSFRTFVSEARAVVLEVELVLAVCQAPNPLQLLRSKDQAEAFLMKLLSPSMCSPTLMPFEVMLVQYSVICCMVLVAMMGVAWLSCQSCRHYTS